MNDEGFCRRCRYPTKDYATNMIYDNSGDWVRCPKCLAKTRKFDQQRTEWNRRVVSFVKRLDLELQEYYQYDLHHGSLRQYLIAMRESGRSPADAVRSWRHKVMYIDTMQTKEATPSSASDFQIRYDTMPERQYRQPSEMPLAVAPEMGVITRTLPPVIFAPPIQLATRPSGLQRTYSEDNNTYSDTDSDTDSDTNSDSSTTSFRDHVSGVMKDRYGRIAVLVKDARGRKAKARSFLAYFVT